MRAGHRRGGGNGDQKAIAAFMILLKSLLLPIRCRQHGSRTSLAATSRGLVLDVLVTALAASHIEAAAIELTLTFKGSLDVLGELGDFHGSRPFFRFGRHHRE